jgi:chemotaxis response regulator CheB
MSSETISLLVVDADPARLGIIEDRLAAMPSVEGVGTAHNLRSARNLVSELLPRR